MIYPKQNSGDQGSANPVTFSPLPIIHIIGNFMRIWSVYSMYHYLSQTGASVVLFIFTCLAPSAIIFLALQQPWKGRPLSNTQVVPSIINGGITALYFILWGKGLKSCGPVRAIMAEYSGAVLVLSAVLYGRTGHVWKKITYGFLFSKAFNGCWRMHHYYGDCVQNGFFCTGLSDLLHNFGLWDISSNIFGTF
ncbi:hypothetical protein LOK49_LG01G03521 [Camellia lanceoleosa]|uniref:Uncharacterized protein n=1 Tax=Camellia lanceoleosa TaxID=1840588 RepID=A0ACC0IXA5_9ERIC|nr:hypothetical protein LOK49_LG01G03521 [Camellia lanceoleosa]